MTDRLPELVEERIDAFSLIENIRFPQTPSPGGQTIDPRQPIHVVEKDGASDGT